MSKKTKMNNNYDDLITSHINNYLRINRINSTEKNIECLKKEITNILPPESGYPKGLVFYYLFEILEPLNPHILFHVDYYMIDGLDEICVYIVWYKVKQLKIEINKQLLHEFAYQAEIEYLKWFNDAEGNVKDYFHAVNKVLKIYKDGNWRTPDNFLDKFPGYQEKTFINLK